MGKQGEFISHWLTRTLA